ncbi:hypothetical protein DUNSADRAFT_7913 [Dunaliella salina]|uniref:Uncharacterized protein n=1 Tax=Dunaliella salina TaxID=3046 RepID=A0ABQ7GKD0_DUNSA|nr:hypothetical protein DUNSADRAFT_7913 [Dunaliella salina]|eukprot:KAF5835063.1 hypothetical protein DUNSADRAFT_7913 [Dunaliella salina]
MWLSGWAPGERMSCPWLSGCSKIGKRCIMWRTGGSWMAA